MRHPESRFSLSIDYNSKSDRDDSTYEFNLSELPEEKLQAVEGIPDEMRLGVFFAWDNDGNNEVIKLCFQAPHDSGDDYNLENRTLTATVPLIPVLSVISDALEKQKIDIQSKDAGKLLVAIGKTLLRQGELK